MKRKQLARIARDMESHALRFTDFWMLLKRRCDERWAVYGKFFSKRWVTGQDRPATLMAASKAAGLSFSSGARLEDRVYKWWRYYRLYGRMPPRKRAPRRQG